MKHIDIDNALRRVAERRIEEAMREGKFDNLPGMGRPVNLEGYFATPEHVRIGYSILKSAGFVPEEVELLKEIQRLKTELGQCADETGKARINAALNETVLKYNLLMDRYRRERRTARY